MTIDCLQQVCSFLSSLGQPPSPELVLFSLWLLSQSYFTLCVKRRHQKPSCSGLAGPVTNFMCRQFIRELFIVWLFYHRSHFYLCLGRLKGGNVGGNSCHVPTVAWGVLCAILVSVFLSLHFPLYGDPGPKPSRLGLDERNSFFFGR